MIYNFYYYVMFQINFRHTGTVMSIYDSIF